jgi:hypothetical protein
MHRRDQFMRIRVLGIVLWMALAASCAESIRDDSGVDGVWCDTADGPVAGPDAGHPHARQCDPGWVCSTEGLLPGYLCCRHEGGGCRF